MFDVSFIFLILVISIFSFFMSFTQDLAIIYSFSKTNF